MTTFDPNTFASPVREIKRTTSRCPVCLDPIAADIREIGGKVYMTKRCPSHGRFEVLLARDASRYYDAKATGGACCSGTSGCCGPTLAPPIDTGNPFDTLSTCIAIIEIVDSCNLSCPTCFASSPRGVGEEIDCSTFENVTSRIKGVLERKGFIDVLQLSGGEPTIHPRFLNILEWAVDRKDIGYILINTNGVRLAGDRKFREEVGSLRTARGKFELYLQFDGPQQEGQVELRGVDLRELRLRVLDECGSLGIPSTLAMTVTRNNIAHLGDAMRMGVERPHCRGITYQPMFHSGRTHVVSSTLPVLGGGVHTPLSVGDVIAATCSQAGDLISPRDFTPLPCGDPNCHTIAYLLRTKDGPVGLSRLIDVESMQGFLSNRVDYRLEDLARCGCDSEPLGGVIKAMELRPESPFRIFIKPFMDAWTFDTDRIDRCCTHVIKRDGSLDSFCNYYLNGGPNSLQAGHA
jgi:uncharacterized radical SAM superfamily Fe-S cluster-containing enzyme